MSLTATLPAPPRPHLDSGLLPGDFYGYEDLLSKQERETVERLREFLR
ncbi:MAG: gcdH1, partial [Frankiales bacterium]|nr:gcdH1 [Frankiales bacterium]